MAENSATSWTDHTFNPWIGCMKVGPGCDHCYAEAWDARGMHKIPTRWGAGAPRTRTSAANWAKPRQWNRLAERTGVRPWVFCASLADVFDNEVPPEWRVRLWDLVRETPLLRWIFVTKRIGNAAKMMPPDWPEAFGHCGLVSTIVNQAEADRDIPKLLGTPAAWRGLSMEPLLGPMDLFHVRESTGFTFNALSRKVGISFRGVGLDWIIVGGESGRDARPMHPDWARSIRDQCAAAGVAFHFKQWGEWAPTEAVGIIKDEPITDRSGGVRDWMHRYVVAADDAWGARVRAHSFTRHATNLVYRVGKARAGRLLDGVEHNGMPALGASS